MPIDKKMLRTRLSELLGMLGEGDMDDEMESGPATKNRNGGAGLDNDDGQDKTVTDLTPELQSVPDEALRVPPIDKANVFKMPMASSPKDYQKEKEKELGLKAAAASIKRKIGQ